MSKRGCTVVAGLQAVTYGLKRRKIGVEDKYFFVLDTASKRIVGVGGGVSPRR